MLPDRRHYNYFVYIACYAQRYGPRGIGHAGGLFLGLMSDALDIEWQRYIYQTTLGMLVAHVFLSQHAMCMSLFL